MKYILLEKLEENDNSTVLKLIKYNFDDPEISNFFIQTVLSTYQYKYNSIELLASVLSELYEYNHEIVQRVRDSLLESIYLDMELNQYNHNQQRVCNIKLLGEFFNYQIIEFEELMEILYLIIHFSHRITDDNSSCFKYSIFINI